MVSLSNSLITSPNSEKISTSESTRTEVMAALLRINLRRASVQGERP